MEMQSSRDTFETTCSFRWVGEGVAARRLSTA
jgi:hypothetical protein